MTIARIAVMKIEGTMSEDAEPTSNLSVSTNSTIDKVEIEEVGNKQKVVVAHWTLDTTYTPKIGSIEVKGKAWVVGEPEKLTTKSGGKLTLVPAQARDLHQAVLRMPLIVSINTARELGLPIPMNFPTVEINDDKGKEKKGEAG
jgi:hypothetical protein